MSAESSHQRKRDDARRDVRHDMALDGSLQRGEKTKAKKKKNTKYIYS